MWILLIVQYREYIVLSALCSVRKSDTTSTVVILRIFAHTLRTLSSLCRVFRLSSLNFVLENKNSFTSQTMHSALVLFTPPTRGSTQ